MDLDIQLDCGCCEGGINEKGDYTNSYMTPLIKKSMKEKVEETTYSKG